MSFGHPPPATRFRLYITEEGFWVRFGRLLRLAAAESYKNNCLATAKGAAYSALLSFFPVLTTMTALLVQARAEDVARTIAAFLYEVVQEAARARRTRDLMGILTGERVLAGGL